MQTLTEQMQEVVKLAEHITGLPLASLGYNVTNYKSPTWDLCCCGAGRGQPYLVMHESFLEAYTEESIRNQWILAQRNYQLSIVP